LFTYCGGAEQEEETMERRKIPGTMMNGSDIYMMAASGYTPLGVVIGKAARTVGAGGFFNAILSLGRKGHVEAVGEVSQEVRQLAYEDALHEAEKLGPDVALIVVHEMPTQNYTGVQITTCVATAFKKSGEGFRNLHIAAG
jgi:uncharacterized protein YbjQ (UPF0145 family)